MDDFSETRAWIQTLRIFSALDPLIGNNKRSITLNLPYTTHTGQEERPESADQPGLASGCFPNIGGCLTRSQANHPDS